MDADIIEQARALFEQAGYIAHIQNQSDYDKALSLMDELIEEYDRNRSLIEVLSNSIERWEASADEFAAFNRQVEAMDDGVAVLRLLMDQHGLTGSDLPELGSKSLISKILKGERSLTRRHIQALSKRFGINPTVFFG